MVKKVLTNVHYHVKKSCLKRLQAFKDSEVFYENPNDITDAEFERFKSSGANLDHLKSKKL